MSLLTVVQSFCERTGLPKPVTVMGNAFDDKIQQIRALLEEEGNDLSRRHDWERLTYEQSLTTIAAEDQGSMESLTSDSFRHIKNQTIWSHARRLPVAGPVDPRSWRALKALFVNGPYYRFRIRGSHLLVNPVPPAGESWFFEYVSGDWILDPNGVTTKSLFTSDDDTLLIPEEIALTGLRWRWKKEKGLEYAEDFRTYEMQAKDAMGWDGGRQTLRMDEWSHDGPKPGIFVPNGSWMVP